MAKPSLTTAEIQKAIQKIRQVHTRTIDGELLANMVEICHECALKNREIRELTIGDVSQAGRVHSEMIINGTPGAVSVKAQRILQSHIDHLKKSGYSLRLEKPLFPQKSGDRYNTNTFNNHIDGCLDNKDPNIRLEKVKQAGIRNYHNELLKQGLSDNECLRQTADFARCDKNNSNEMRHLKDLLKCEIQATGKKPFKPDDPMSYVADIENAPYQRQKSTDEIITELEKIEISVNKNQNLSDELKGALYDFIRSQIDQVKALEINQNAKPPAREFSSFKDILEVYESEIRKYIPMLMEWVEYFGFKTGEPSPEPSENKTNKKSKNGDEKLDNSA